MEFYPEAVTLCPATSEFVPVPFLASLHAAVYAWEYALPETSFRIVFSVLFPIRNPLVPPFGSIPKYPPVPAIFTSAAVSAEERE
jgi:hypothetical protein